MFHGLRTTGRHGMSDLAIAALPDDAEAACRPALDGASDDAQALLGLGHGEHARGQTAAALAHFEAAGVAAPDNPWPHVYAADELRLLGREADAEDGYRRALALADTDAARLHALLGLGHCAQARGDHAAALTAFAAAALAQPENPWPHLYAGHALRHLDRGEEAEAAYRLALAEGANRAQALLGLGHCAQRRGGHDEALAHFRAAADAEPDNSWPQLYAGHELRHLERPVEAAAAYRAALALDAGPARLHALLGLGHCARQAGDLAGALAQFEAAAVASPADPWPHLYVAGALRDLGRTAQAAGAYHAVLAIDPRHYRATVELGLLARDAGDRAGATALFRAAAAIDPVAASAWLELASDLRDLGDTAAALAVAGDMLARDPRDALAWASLAATHHVAGQWQAALDALRRLADIDPGRPDAWIEMALNERRLGRAAAARACLERALALSPEHVRAVENLGELARLERDFERALALFRRAVAAGPANPWPRIGLAQTLADLGRLGEALAALDDAEERAPAHDPARPALAGRRVELLRRAGHWTRALDAAREAAGIWPRNFPLWVQRCLIELLAGDPATVAACLDSAPVATAAERARVLQLRGQAAEAEWRPDAAAAHYADALRLTPEDGWIHQNRARACLLRLDLDTARAHLRAMVDRDSEFAVLTGRFPRVSWTHYGEILNEYAMDRHVLTALLATRDDPPGQRVVPLLALAREHPDSIAVAVALLLALRQAGHLAVSAPPAACVSAIPRRIVQYWDSGEPPPDVRALMRTWRDWHPDHETRLFDDAAAAAFLAGAYAPDVLAAYRRAAEPAQKADLFRLAWLYARGGCYIDCDDRCHAPLDAVVPRHATLALYQEDLGTLGNNFIAAVPHHPLLGRALDVAVAAVNAGDTDAVWLGTGPGLMTRAFAQTLAGSRLLWPEWLSGLAVLDRSELYRAVAIHCFVGYKMTERHWSQARVGRGKAYALK